MTFQELGLNRPILKALAGLGYQQPSPIQEKAIPPALKGQDILGCAQTGTGKTCAFAAPILQRLAARPRRGPRPIRALILTPTRELAMQIQESFEAYGAYLPLRSAVIFGGVGQAPQVAQLKKGVDILSATPGRLCDLYQQKLLDFSQLEILVLDEADRMLDMGFIHDVRKILKWLPKQKQTLFFSATLPPEILDLATTLLHDPVQVAANPISSPVESIDQRIYFVDRGNKSKLLASLIKDKSVKNALVFTRTKHGANKVAGDLIKAGVTAAAIHGNKSQTARQQALSDFKVGRVKALVATDIAARGLDIEELSHVFNYNLPDVPETYVHRIGRTGRAGRGGTAVSFCDITEKDALKAIQRLIGREIPVVENHPWPMQVLTAPLRDNRGGPVSSEDSEARAPARQRRHQENVRHPRTPLQVADPNRAEPARQTLPPAKPHQTGQPPALSPSAPEQGKKRRGRPRRNSATLEEALKATAPAQEIQEELLSDFEHPDPLAGEVIMDATARLLAPRNGRGDQSSSGNPARKGRGHRSGTAPARPPLLSKRSSGAPIPAKKMGGRLSQNLSHRAPQIRHSAQKDSTEQPSLMKPYYITPGN